MMRDSSWRALSLCPAATSFRAVLSIAPACKSFGTVSTSHATTAPRSDETMAVRMSRLRARTDGDVQERRQHYETRPESVAREGALDNLAPRSARGSERVRGSWPRRRPPQNARAARDLVAAASAAAESSAHPNPAQSAGLDC